MGNRRNKGALGGYFRPTRTADRWRRTVTVTAASATAGYRRMHITQAEFLLKNG